MGNKLYTGGDRRVYVSDIQTGEMLHQITRDTGMIGLLVKFEENIMCCSANGAIRAFEIMHNVKRIHLVSQSSCCSGLRYPLLHLLVPFRFYLFLFLLFL